MSKKDFSLMLERQLFGHYIEDIPEDCTKKVAYVLQGDGIWERRRNDIGVFDLHAAEYNIPGLKSDMEEGWELHTPKIPAEILVQITSFFRKINKLYDSEVFVQVYWNKEEEEYFAIVPEQRVSGASVHYENNEAFTDPNNVLVFEIHSHNTMSAFFSGVDDADEVADRFYGVIGRINQFYPEIKIRLSIGGRKMAVEVEDLFDIDEDTKYTENFPAQWLENVQKQHFIVRKYRNKTVHIPVHGNFPGQRGFYLLEDGEDDEDGEDNSNPSDEQMSFFGDKPPKSDDDDGWEEFLTGPSDDDNNDDSILHDWRKGKF